MFNFLKNNVNGSVSLKYTQPPSLPLAASGQ